MKAQERDEIAQYFIRTRAKTKELERNFVDLIELIDNYKVLVINAQIDELKEEKKKKWWQV